MQKKTSHAHTHTIKQTNTRIYTYRHKHTSTHIHKRTHTDTHMHKRISKHTHINTHISRLIHKQTHTDRHIKCKYSRKRISHQNTAFQKGIGGQQPTNKLNTKVHNSRTNIIVFFSYKMIVRFLHIVFLI